jgi:hypothetical protein
MTRISSLLCCALLLAACGPEQQDKPEASQNRNAVDVARAAAGQQENGTPTETERMSATTACYTVDTGKKVVLRAQTFAIDFEPFRNSCFVTSHDAEYKDPALNSEFAIFKNGQRVFSFPDQFNGVTLGCWVEAVAFQDVNRDRRTDVVVVGKCSGKSDSYYENSVYLNDGKTFVTNPEANSRLSDLTTIKAIVDFLQKNPDHVSLTPDAANSNSQP